MIVFLFPRGFPVVMSVYACTWSETCPHGKWEPPPPCSTWYSDPAPDIRTKDVVPKARTCPSTSGGVWLKTKTQPVSYHWRQTHHSSYLLNICTTPLEAVKSTGPLVGASTLQRASVSMRVCHDSRWWSAEVLGTSEPKPELKKISLQKQHQVLFHQNHKKTVNNHLATITCQSHHW